MCSTFCFRRSSYFILQLGAGGAELNIGKSWGGGAHWAKNVNFLQKYKSLMFHYVVHSLQPLAYLNKTDPSGTPCKQIFVNTLKVTPICYLINF